MVKVSELIQKQNVLVVNTFSKYGALGGEKKYGIDVLWEQKNNDHNVNTNFLSASTIRIGQDSFDNIFRNPMGLILEDGEIYYAKRGDDGDIAYTPGTTSVEYMNGKADIIKPCVNDDLISVIGPRDKNHNELLILNPTYKGLFFWCNCKYEFRYNIDELIKFSTTKNIFLYSIDLDNEEKINHVDQIIPTAKRYTDAITLINEKFE